MQDWCGNATHLKTPGSDSVSCHPLESSSPDMTGVEAAGQRGRRACRTRRDTTRVARTRYGGRSVHVTDATWMPRFSFPKSQGLWHAAIQTVTHKLIAISSADGDMSQPPPETIDPKVANRARFELELEFVQSLANPYYLHSLAQQGILSQPAFVNFLRYLLYWKEKDYARFIL